MTKPFISRLLCGLLALLISGEVFALILPSQARRAIQDCYSYSLQPLNTGSGLICPDVVDFLTEWTRQHYASPEDVFKVISDARSVDDLYVPLFTLAANAYRLNEKQKLEAAAKLRLVLDQMAGFRAELAAASERHADFFRNFAVDIMVAMAVAGVRPAETISYLNLMSQRFEKIRLAYHRSLWRRVRFFINFATLPAVKESSLEEKSGYGSSFLYRRLAADIPMESVGYYGNPFNLSLWQRFKWRREAGKFVFEKPTLNILEALLPMIGDAERELDDMGQWARAVLINLGFDVFEDRGGGGRRRQREDDYLKLFDCETALAPVPVPVRTR